jgi:hypothetical protein
MRVSKLFTVGCILLALLTGCRESAKQRRAREESQRRSDETVFRNKVLSRYASAVDFAKEGERELFAPMLTVEVQEQIAARPEQLYWIEVEHFNVLRRGSEIVLSIKTIDDSWVDLTMTQTQLDRVIAH